MTAKIITFLIIGGVNLAVSVFLLFFLMLGLNGFSESDANYAFLFFIIGAFVVAVLSGILGIVLLDILIGKNFRSISGSIIAILIFSILGIIINIALWFGGLIVAEIVRTSR
jgi:hypothetical protein